jgi:PhnB protein
MPINGDTELVPSGYARINPWVISRDVDAEIQFLSQVFGAQERPDARVVNADGTIGHAEVELAGSVVLMFDAQPGWPDLPAHLRVYVDDVQRTVDDAVAAGEWVARLRDPQGHLWWIHERVEALDLEEMARRSADPAYQQAMAYVQETLTAELQGGDGSPTCSTGRVRAGRRAAPGRRTRCPPGRPGPPRGPGPVRCRRGGLPDRSAAPPPPHGSDQPAAGPGAGGS